MRIETLLYDLDGTLCDSAANIGQAVNRTRADLGLEPLPVAHVGRYIGEGARVLVERAFFGLLEPNLPRPAAVLPWALDRYEAVFSAFMTHYGEDPISHVTLFDGVIEALTHFRAQGVKQAVLTNKPHAFTGPLLDALGVTPLLDDVLGRFAVFDGHEVPSKPDPRSVAWLLGRLGRTREGTWLIGDGLADARVAEAAGIGFVLIRDGYGDPDRVLRESRPAAVVSSFAEAAAWLQALG